MKYTTKICFFLALIALLCSGCSTQNSSGSQTEAVKPPPQVRVEAMPSATSTPALPIDLSAPTLEVTLTPEQVYYYDPTPDEDTIMNQIDALMDQIDQKLNSQDLLLKP